MIFFFLLFEFSDIKICGWVRNHLLYQTGGALHRMYAFLEQEKENCWRTSLWLMNSSIQPLLPASPICSQADWLPPWSSVQFSSVAQSCPTLCNPMNCSMPGLPVHHHLPEFTQTQFHRVSDAIQPSHPLSSPSSPAPNPSQHQSLFQWVNSSHGVSASASFLPKKSQGWSPSEWTGWMSLQSKGLSRVFSNNTVQKHQFFVAQPSSQSNSPTMKGHEKQKELSTLSKGVTRHSYLYSPMRAEIHN